MRYFSEADWSRSTTSERASTIFPHLLYVSSSTAQIGFKILSNEYLCITQKYLPVQQRKMSPQDSLIHLNRNYLRCISRVDRKNSFLVFQPKISFKLGSRHKHHPLWASIVFLWMVPGQQARSCYIISPFSLMLHC